MWNESSKPLSSSNRRPLTPPDRTSGTCIVTSRAAIHLLLFDVQTQPKPRQSGHWLVTSSSGGPKGCTGLLE